MKKYRKLVGKRLSSEKQNAGCRDKRERGPYCWRISGPRAAQVPALGSHERPLDPGCLTINRSLQLKLWWNPIKGTSTKLILLLLLLLLFFIIITTVIITPRTHQGMRGGSSWGPASPRKDEMLNGAHCSEFSSFSLDGSQGPGQPSLRQPSVGERGPRDLETRSSLFPTWREWSFLPILSSIAHSSNMPFSKFTKERMIGRLHEYPTLCRWTQL